MIQGTQLIHNLCTRLSRRREPGALWRHPTVYWQMSNLSSRRERGKSQRGSVEVWLGQGEKGLPGTSSHHVAPYHPRFREMSDTISAASAVGLFVSSGTVFLIVSKVHFTLHQLRTRQRGFRGTQLRSKFH